MNNVEADPCRLEVVERLRKAGLEGISTECRAIGDTSAAEVLSAIFSMAMSCVQYVDKTSAPALRAHNLEQTRQVIYRMLAETADSKVM